MAPEFSQGVFNAFSIFIFLGWFLLSVQNNKFSNILTLYIGCVLEKFKKLPATNIVDSLVKVLYCTI